MSESGGDSSDVVFEDNGDYIETNLITEDDLKSYRLHVATEEGSRGAPLQEALPAMELAKIIYKRRKLKQEVDEAEEREKSIEKLKEKLGKKKKKKGSERSISPKSATKRQYRKKTPEKKERSKSPKRIKSEPKSPKRIKSEPGKKTPEKKERSKSPKQIKSESRCRKKTPEKKDRSQSPKVIKSECLSPKKSNKPQKKSRSTSRSRKKSRSRSKTRKKSRSQSKTRKKSRSQSKTRKKSRSRSKTRKKARSRSNTRKKSPSQIKSRKKSRSQSRSRKKSRSRSKDKSNKRGSHRHRSKDRSRSRGKSKRHGRKVWESKSRSRSRSKSRDRDEFIKKCKSVQDGPDLPESRPVDRRKRHHRSRSKSSSTERPVKGLPSSTSYLAIEGPEVDKALVTLYPSATPSLGLPTLDRVRLPTQLAQQLFPVSCGNEHKDEEGQEEKQASILAIEGASAAGEKKVAEEEKKPANLSEIMQMRIEANKLLVKNPSDTAAKKILHEAQILMNRWQAVSAKSTGGRYTGAALATPMPKEIIDSHHPLTWARKDMFMNLAPVTESPGMQLMMKMGWSSGKGLGKEESGDVNPLRLSVKTDRKGLSSDQEIIRRNPAADRGINVVGCNWVVKIVNGKHAVSGLGEIHQHIGKSCPEYIDSLQPGVHLTTCKTAWGQFTPVIPATNKKEAKGQSAVYALKRILAIEADKYNQQCPEEEPHSGTMCVVFQSTTAALQANKYQSNFSDPNKVTIPDQNPTQVARPNLPSGIQHLRPPAQELRPSVQRSSIQRPSIRAAMQCQPLQRSSSQHPVNMAPNQALQKSIENLIANQRLAADRPSINNVPRMNLSNNVMQRPMYNQGGSGMQPRPGFNIPQSRPNVPPNRTNLMQSRPNIAQCRPNMAQSRSLMIHQNNVRATRPLQNTPTSLSNPIRQNGAPRPQGGTFGSINNIQKMIAMATRLTRNDVSRPPS